ncbi:hypothetical protein JMG10_07645 [Nostoc ellipsosporum NOK]|nr:hypothetical protein [Nostoc ellipsosporum NOK]
MSCETACYETTVAQCSSLVLKAGLPPSTDFFVLINRSWSNTVHQRRVQTNGNGDLEIDKADYPAGFFTGGSYHLRLRQTSGGYDIQDLTFDTKQYECCLFTVKQYDLEPGDASPINVIQ